MNGRTEKQVGNGRIDPLVWRIAGVALFGPLMISLDSTIVNVSLAKLGQELHASLAVIQWVTSGYLLALALMLPLSGWLVDRIGAKRVYLGCFTAFTAASMFCGCRDFGRGRSSDFACCREWPAACWLPWRR